VDRLKRGELERKFQAVVVCDLGTLQVSSRRKWRALVQLVDRIRIKPGTLTDSKQK